MGYKYHIACSKKYTIVRVCSHKIEQFFIGCCCYFIQFCLLGANSAQCNNKFVIDSSSYIEEITHDDLNLLDTLVNPCRAIIFSVCGLLFGSIVDGAMFVWRKLAFWGAGCPYFVRTSYMYPSIVALHVLFL